MRSRVWNCLGHDRRGDAVTTSHVGDLATLLQEGGGAAQAGMSNLTKHPTGFSTEVYQLDAVNRDITLAGK